MIQEYLEKLANFVKRHKFVLFVLWLSIIIFLALDGINSNLYEFDIDFFFRGIYNNRVILYLPVWGWLFFKVARKRESKIKNLLEKYSLIIFIVVLNVYNIIEVLPYDDYISYIIRLIISFFVIVVVIPFVKKILNLLDKRIENHSNFNLNDNISFQKKEIVIFVCLIIAVLVTRFLFLDGLPPTTDEYLHLNEAKKAILPNGVLFHNGDYSRAPFINSMLKELFVSFNMSVSIARLPGVIISCLTVVLFYLLLKNENKTIAILTAVFFAFSPWSIMLSRTVREYTYFLPFFLMLGVYVYRRVKTIIDRKYKFLDFFVDVSILSSVVYYCFFLDPLSTAKFSLIIYFAGFVYWLINFVKGKNFLEKIGRDTLEKLFLIIWSIFITLIMCNKFLGVSLTVSQIDIIPSFNLSWIGYIFLDGKYGSLIVGGVFLAVALVSSILDMKKNGYKSFLSYVTIMFLIIIYFFTFHFGRYYRPRYISIILPFVICLQAYGFLILRNFLCNELRINKWKTVILFLLFINWGYVFYSFLSNGTGYVRVTQEFHEGYESVYNEIEDIDEGYVLVSSLPDAADWYWDEDISEILKFSYADPERERVLDEIVKTHDRGFFVIDLRRNIWGGYLFKDGKDYRTESGYRLKFLSTVDVYSIYKWDRS